jgi:glycosyltransferase involved in cell wall biosynthesis
MGADLTIGIPAYRAEETIEKTLMSIATQTWIDKCCVIIASDDPNTDYDYLEDSYGEFFDIKTLPCEENTGPGLARQRCLDACQTPWITFIDADDILANPLAIENLLIAVNSPQVIEVQGPFLAEHKIGEKTVFAPRNDITHPWVFGRIYNTKFLKDNKIAFSELRAMEDGEFNWKIRMTIDGTPFKINVINEPVYIWKEGSDHSITRTGIDDKGIPQYNFDLCPVGSTIAAINAAKFCKERNPFNGGITRFIVETMIGQYFTYVECLEKRPIFAKQCMFNAKRFYNECYSEIENGISDDILKTMYTAQYAGKAPDLIGIIPKMTFFDFMGNVKSSNYGGEEELIAIRNEFPKEILDNDKKTGVAIF